MAQRREKFDETKKAEYLDLLRNGGRRQTSARSIGIDPSTIVDHMNKYPDFAFEVSKAEMEANEQVEDAMFQAATSGNVTAMQIWLYNRMPTSWADKRNIKVQGAEGGPVQISVDPADLEAKVQAILTKRHEHH
jgi:hypothetical protein